MSEVYNEVHRTRVLHTARISNVDSVIFVDGNIREIVIFELGKEIKKDVIRLVTSGGQRKQFWLSVRGPRLDSSCGLRIFSLSHARDETKNIFLYFFNELKTSHLSYFSIYEHYAIDIADPSCMQDACHMNFVTDLAHRGVSVAQW